MHSRDAPKEGVFAKCFALQVATAALGGYGRIW